MIQIRGLTKSFGHLHVLDDVSLDIRRGAVTAILGPNASGKSTLIKCILGLVNPDSGTIRVDDEQILGAWRYRRRIGYMPQSAQYPDNLTVDELFRLLGDLRREDGERDIELFARYELGAIGSRRLNKLSGGTIQKVSAAIAFMFSPRYLVLDEPTVGLDPVAAVTLKDKINRAREENRAILLTSHVISEVEELADHIVYLLDGKPFFEGSTTELKQAAGEARLDRAIVRIMEARHEA